MSAVDDELVSEVRPSPSPPLPNELLTPSFENIALNALRRPASAVERAWVAASVAVAPSRAVVEGRAADDCAHAGSTQAASSEEKSRAAREPIESQEGTCAVGAGNIRGGAALRESR